MGLFDRFKKFNKKRKNDVKSNNFHFCTNCGQKMTTKEIICPKCNLNTVTRQFENKNNFSNQTVPSQPCKLNFINIEVEQISKGKKS